MTDDLSAIRAKLYSGEALTPGEVVAVTGTSRTKCHHMLVNGELPYRT
jgi:hypothetical protein